MVGLDFVGFCLLSLSRASVIYCLLYLVFFVVVVIVVVSVCRRCCSIVVLITLGHCRFGCVGSVDGVVVVERYRRR